MRARLLVLIVMSMLLGGWFDDPPSWARPDGGPIDPDLFHPARIIYANRASVYTGREDLWQATFSKCMRQYRYVPCVATSFPDPHRTTEGSPHAISCGQILKAAKTREELRCRVPFLNSSAWEAFLSAIAGSATAALLS